MPCYSHSVPRACPQLLAREKGPQGQGWGWEGSQSWFWPLAQPALPMCLRAPKSIFDGFSSVQFSSVSQSCPTLFDPMNCSKPGFPVHYQFPETAQTHVHRVSDAIQPSYPLNCPLLLLPSVFPSIRVFSSGSVFCNRCPRLELQLQCQSFQ